MNRREIDNFPFDLSRASLHSHRFSILATELSRSLKSTSDYRVMRYKHDTLTVQCIIPKHSKHIIDEIDCVLGRHYGLTDEELNFIINYDIKYRMGRGILEEDEE